MKVSVVGGGQGGTKVWRREHIEMTDPDLDDVAFLSGVFVCVYLCGCCVLNFQIISTLSIEINGAM